MTSLIVKILETDIVQPFTLTNRRYQIAGVKPYLYIHNAPSGTFTLSILRNSEVIASKSFDASDIYNSLDMVNLYAHVFYPVIYDKLIVLSDDNYQLKLESSGYTYSDSSYIGWIKEYESIYVPFSENIATQDDYPCAFRILDYQKRELI